MTRVNFLPCQAMLLLVGAPSFFPRLFPTLQFLANDNSPRVRHTVASGYHEVVLLLGDQSTSVAGIFQNLLRNKSIEVSNRPMRFEN